MSWERELRMASVPHEPIQWPYSTTLPTRDCPHAGACHTAPPAQHAHCIFWQHAACTCWSTGMQEPDHDDNGHKDPANDASDDGLGFSPISFSFCFHVFSQCSSFPHSPLLRPGLKLYLPLQHIRRTTTTASTTSPHCYGHHLALKAAGHHQVRCLTTSKNPAAAATPMYYISATLPSHLARPCHCLAACKS